MIIEENDESTTFLNILKSWDEKIIEKTRFE